MPIEPIEPIVPEEPIEAIVPIGPEELIVPEAPIVPYNTQYLYNTCKYIATIWGDAIWYDSLIECDPMWYSMTKYDVM